MKSGKDLEGQVAIVTGAARGIGKAISVTLAAAGATVVLVDMMHDEGNKVLTEIVAMGSKALFIRCDLKSEDDVVAMVNRAIAEFGRIDILVNNAGIGRGAAPTWETPTEVWDEIVGVNLRGTFLCTKYIAPHMISQKSGRIVSMSSALGKQVEPMWAAYSISKAGIIALTVALAKEIGQYGITANTICPGPVDTPVWDKKGDMLNQHVARQIVKTLSKPEDIANVVYWLVSSDEGKLITGQAISVDGGIAFPTY